MKWLKKKGIWFCAGLEIICALISLAGLIAFFTGFVLETVLTAIVLGAVVIIANGGDFSI